MNRLAIIGYQCCRDLLSVKLAYNYCFNGFAEGLIFARDSAIKNILKYLHTNRQDLIIVKYLNSTYLNVYYGD